MPSAWPTDTEKDAIMNVKPLPFTRASSYASWARVRTQSTSKRSPSNVKTTWLDSQRQACSDFRARSGRGCLWVLAFLWVCGLTAGFVVLCVWSAEVSRSWSSGSSLSACLPDDSFSLRPDRFQYWSRSGFFQITLGSGDLTFTQAKAIDVIWDIVVGRGGQGLLAYFSWQTFVRYVTTSMEVQPVTFNTYRMIFLQNESLVLGIPRIIRDFCKRRGLHSRFAMVFIVLTMIFVLVFPTLGSAMTGYSGNVMPYVPDSDGNFLPFHDFSIVLYTIHDGARINKTDDYHVTKFKGANDIDDPVLTDMTYWRARYASASGPGPRICADYPYEYQREQCSSEMMLWNISRYVGNYGTTPRQDVLSTFGDTALGSPTLNITAYDLSNGLNKSNSDVQSRYDQWAGNSSMFVSNGKLYSQADIERDAQCQAQKTYQWGFSFVQLTIMLILLWVWTLGIIIMYTSSKITRLQRGTEDVAGEYKAVFELSDAMHAQLDPVEEEEAKDVRQITESTLRRRITNDLHGGAIAYDTNLLPKADEYSEKVGWTFKAWAKREMWWLFSLAFAIMIDGIVIDRFFKDGLRSDLWFFPALPLTIGFAMYVGLTHLSRLMVLFWGILVMCVLPAIILAVVLQNLTRMYW